MELFSENPLWSRADLSRAVVARHPEVPIETARSIMDRTFKALQKQHVNQRAYLRTKILEGLGAIAKEAMECHYEKKNTGDFNPGFLNTGATALKRMAEVAGAELSQAEIEREEGPNLDNMTPYEIRKYKEQMIKELLEDADPEDVKQLLQGKKEEDDENTG